MANKKVGADGISKEMFKKALESAIKSAGSVFELSKRINIQTRRIYMWRSGNGPSYPKMQKVYEELEK